MYTCTRNLCETWRNNLCSKSSFPKQARSANHGIVQEPSTGSLRKRIVNIYPIALFYRSPTSLPGPWPVSAGSTEEGGQEAILPLGRCSSLYFLNLLNTLSYTYYILLYGPDTFCFSPPCTACCHPLCSSLLSVFLIQLDTKRQQAVEPNVLLHLLP